MMKNHYVRVRARHIKCYEDQPGWGDDEIAVGGVAIYHDFRTKTFLKHLGSFSEGYSKDRDIKVFGMSMCGGDRMSVSTPWGTIRPFYHNPGTSGIPKFFGAVIIMAERDTGGFREWIEDHVHPVVKDKAKKVKEKVVGDLINGVGPSAASILSGLSLSQKLKNRLQWSAIWAGGPGIGDDIFTPDTILFWTRTNAYERFPADIRGSTVTDTANQSRHYRDPSTSAHYRLRLDWKMYT